MFELPMVLSLDRVNLTDDQFYCLCEANPTTPLERSVSGALVIMSPVGGESGEREADLITDLTLWNRQTKLGKVLAHQPCSNCRGAATDLLMRPGLSCRDGNG